MLHPSLHMSMPQWPAVCLPTPRVHRALPQRPTWNPETKMWCWPLDEHEAVLDALKVPEKPGVLGFLSASLLAESELCWAGTSVWLESIDNLQRPTAHLRRSLRPCLLPSAPSRPERWSGRAALRCGCKGAAGGLLLPAWHAAHYGGD